jgi:hypothetical protein
VARFRNLRNGALIVAVFAISGVTAEVAWAHHIYNMVGNVNYNRTCVDGQIGDGTPLCRTDNATLTYHLTPTGNNALEVDDRNVVLQTLAGQFDSPNTDLNTVRHTDPVLTGSAETDIIYEEGYGDVPAGQDGWTWCQDGDSAGVWDCDQQYVRDRTRRRLAAWTQRGPVAGVRGPRPRLPAASRR